MDKIESGTLQIRKEIVPAQLFVAESVQMFLPTALEKAIQLVVTNASFGKDSESLKPTDLIEIDAFKIRQVLRNVISNALKVRALKRRVS